jgi:hypothetical protein
MVQGGEFMIGENVFTNSLNDPIANALAGEIVVHANALSTVTRKFLVIRDSVSGSQVMVSTGSITEVRKVTTTNPGFLVISSGLFTIAAASYASHQGMDVSIPIALLGALFVMGYVGTRRAAVLFVMGNDRIKTVRGSFREATSVIRAVHRVRESDLEPNVTS